MADVLSSIDPMDLLNRYATRGSCVRTAFKVLDAHNQRSQIEARLGPEQSAAINKYGESSWVPMRLYSIFCQAIWENGGSNTEPYVEFWREHIADFLQNPVLVGLTATARTLFGMSPHALFKITPRAVAVTYKGLGKVWSESTVGTNEARVRMIGVPSELLKDPVFAVGHVGTFLGVVDAFNIKTGKGELTELSPERGTFALRISW